MDFDEVSFVGFLGEAKVDKLLLFVVLVIEIPLSSVGIAVAVEAYVSEADIITCISLHIDKQTHCVSVYVMPCWLYLFRVEGKREERDRR